MTNIKDKELFSMLLSNRGGKTRMRILDEIINKPCNANQLAKRLKLDYKTITYHMKIICKHKYAVKITFEKYACYYPSERLMDSIEEYNLIKEYIEK